jgi:hypothetical protein
MVLPLVEILTAPVALIDDVAGAEMLRPAVLNVAVRLVNAEPVPANFVV